MYKIYAPSTLSLANENLSRVFAPPASHPYTYKYTVCIEAQRRRGR